MGSYRGKDGKWHLPPGFKEIDGTIYPPLTLFRNAASARDTLRRVGKKSRSRRIKKAVQERIEPQEIASEATNVPQAQPESAADIRPSGSTGTGLPTDPVQDQEPVVNEIERQGIKTEDEKRSDNVGQG